MTALTPAAEEGERRVHELKTWPPYFGAVKRGEKTFEVRKNDRDYRVGDWLKLCEWLPALECYTGEEHEAQITYLLDGGEFGVESGFCILGLSSPRVEDVRREALEEAAKALKERANNWHREAELHVDGPAPPRDVPAGWLRFRTKGTEASECAELIRALPPSKE